MFGTERVTAAEPEQSTSTAGAYGTQLPGDRQRHLRVGTGIY